MRADLPASGLAELHSIELGADHGAALQRFFEANPAYFMAVGSAPAGPGEAVEVLHDELPAGWTFTKKWLIGYLDAQGDIAAFASVVSDLLAPRVWHIGLFIVATARHGSGDAQALHRGLDRWAMSEGAAWLRLGGVQGNARAERFWASLGYFQTRTRSGITIGRLRA